MEPVVFRYRCLDLRPEDICFIQQVIAQWRGKGRSHISRVICRAWGWVQPNGKLKEYAARDLLLRLEEKGFLELPARLRPKNNLKRNTFGQAPLFCKTSPLGGTLSRYGEVSLRLVTASESFDGQVAACLGWASAAFKIQPRERFIGWGASTRRQRLCFIANNVRFLILPWVSIPHLASKLLALNLRRLSTDWKQAYGHPLYLAETFVDTSRFQGTCYKAANWIYVGQTRGSGKRGNRYYDHGRSKAIYLYPLHRDFRRKLTHDPG